MKLLVGSGNAALDQALAEGAAAAGHEAVVCAYTEALAERAKGVDAAVVGAELPGGDARGLLPAIVALRLEGLRVVYLAGDRDQADRGALIQAVAVGVYDFAFDPVDPGGLVASLAEPASLRRGLAALRRPGERTVGTSQLGEALRVATAPSPEDAPTPPGRRPSRARTPAIPVARRVAGAAAAVASVGSAARGPVTAEVQAAKRATRRPAPPPAEVAGGVPPWWSWPGCAGGSGCDLAVLGALPRSGVTRSLAAWGKARASQVLLIDANPERQALLRVLGGAQGALGWSAAVDPEAAKAAIQGLAGGLRCSEALWPRSGGAPSPQEWVGALDRALHFWRRLGAGVIAADLGSPPAPERGVLHPLIRFAAHATAVAVVAQPDPDGLFAARAICDGLQALGATDLRVWIVGYRPEAATAQELQAGLGVPCVFVAS